MVADLRGLNSYDAKKRKKKLKGVDWLVRLGYY